MKLNDEMLLHLSITYKLTSFRIKVAIFFGDSGAINYNRNELLRAQNKESIKICQSECENKIL